MTKPIIGIAARLTLVVLVLAPVTAATAQDKGPAVAAQAEDPRLAINKRAVLGFYKAISRFDYEAARPFIGDYYIQHSPLIEDGLSGLKKAQDGYRKEFEGRPFPVLDVKQVLAEGDYVVMLSHITLTKGTPGIAVGDLFRLQDGKLVEHWDITEWQTQKPAGQGMFDQQDKAGTGPGIM